jgi:phenylacetate-CoA ligase
MQLTPLEPWIHAKISGEQPANPRTRLSRPDLAAWQLNRLNETLHLARGKSPFYRKLLANSPQQLDSLSALEQVPFTTPEDVRHSSLQMLCVSQDAIQRVVTLQSSGTTGDPKRIYFTSEDQELTIDFFDVGMSTLTSPGDRVLILRPGETPGSVGDLLRQGLQRQGSVPLPYGPVRDPFDTLASMQTQSVDCLVGSPTQILGLALRSAGLDRSRRAPHSVLLSTDYVPAAIARQLEQIWGCEVYNHYGATEMGLGGGVECEAHRGYHLREADLYFEVVDPQTGVPLPDGEYGEVVFSTLTRRGMPLIRYRMGDRSRFLTGECPCGSTLRSLETVCGRFSGFIPIGDGVLRLPDFDEALFQVPGLLNFSVTVLGTPGRERILIRTEILSASRNPTRIARQALEQIPGLDGIDITIDCRHNPNEVGSLLKRVILDQRGAHA